MWCWRCQSDMPMLDEEEYAEIYKFSEASISSEKRNELVCSLYKQYTGMSATNHAAIYHHRISLYGPPCPNCGKPLRTSRASFCAECGHQIVKKDKFKKTENNNADNFAGLVCILAIAYYIFAEIYALFTGKMP